MNRAVPVSGGQEVAIKRPLQWDPTNNERLRREIEILKDISHPNVIQVLDDGIDEDGYYWYTMPLARGSLAALWDGSGSPDEAERLCLWLLDDVGAGLGHMHAKRFTHRDVKPPNILQLDAPGTERGVKWVVADGGLLKRPPGETTHGWTGSLPTLGTDGYIAPETHGDPHSATPVADIYSFGRVLAWVITGKTPRYSARLLPDDPPWRGIVRLLTYDDPDRRPSDMAEAQTRIEALLTALPVSEKGEFRSKIAAKNGALAIDNPLWDVVNENLDDFEFMISDVVTIELTAVRKRTTAVPSDGAALGEQMARHLVNGAYLSFSRVGAPLDLIRTVIEALAHSNEFGLLEDVALPYCDAVEYWDQWTQNDRLRSWLEKLSGPAGAVMARAIHESSSTEYFRSAIARDNHFVSPELRSLLEE